LKDTICLAEVPLCFGTNAFEGYKRTPVFPFSLPFPPSRAFLSASSLPYLRVFAFSSPPFLLSPVPFIPSCILTHFSLARSLLCPPATVDATVVTRVLENGGLIVGKATCENFSHGPASFSSPHGPVQNPYAHGFSTGGSSSGCGALIGSGEVDMGIGGDQGGSIRIVRFFPFLHRLPAFSDRFFSARLPMRYRRSETDFRSRSVHRCTLERQRSRPRWTDGSHRFRRSSVFCFPFLSSVPPLLPLCPY
jgi:hypothetical protein